ncbi:MAG: 50S ribosomal protein L24e [Candidatus Woesearchaeota archaeon]
MTSCDFCGTTITQGTGKMYVQKDGKILRFCSNKCEKNTLQLKRKPRETRWTKEYTQIKKGVKQ